MLTPRYINNLEEILPDELANVCRRVAEHTQTSEPMVMTQLLAAVSAAAMRSYKVDFGSGQVSQLGLAAGIVVDGAEGANVVDAILCKPIREWVSAQNTVDPIDKLDQIMEREIWDAQVKHARKQLKDAVEKGKDLDSAAVELAAWTCKEPKFTPPIAFEVRTGSITGLLEMLQHSGGSIFWNCPEGNAALTATFASGYSALAGLWSGTHPIHVTKSGRLLQYVDVTFAANVVLDPEVFEKIMAGKRGKEWMTSGLLGGFLFVMPTSTQGFRATPLNNYGALGLPEYAARMKQLLDKSKDGSPKVVLSLSDDAYASLQRFRYEIQQRLQPGGNLESHRSVANKISENAARIAAIFHVWSRSKSNVIDRWAMGKALNVAAIYLQEHIAIFQQRLSDMRVERAFASMIRVLERLKNIGVPRVPLSSLSKEGNADLRDPEVRAEAILLAQYRGLVLIENHYSGSITYISLVDQQMQFGSPPTPKGFFLNN